ncbi:MAG TPA: YraN family protein [Verrucomicrobiae bacterium]|nr:YraN family protein [Verrucomicrobiae bacterium]
MVQSQLLGAQGETQAAEFLKRQGFVLIARNVRKRFSEADLICLDGETIVLVEVKTRSTRFTDPLQAVTPQKLRRLNRSLHLLSAQYPNQNIRLDVVAVYWEPGREPLITHYPNII